MALRSGSMAGKPVRLKIKLQASDSSDMHCQMRTMVTIKMVFCLWCFINFNQKSSLRLSLKFAR